MVYNKTCSAALGGSNLHKHLCTEAGMVHITMVARACYLQYHTAGVGAGQVTSRKHLLKVQESR